ncbi:hypothetical protein D3C72_740170 [compost metagenome]
MAALGRSEAAARHGLGQAQQVGGGHALGDHVGEGVGGFQRGQGRQFAVETGPVAQSGVGHGASVMAHGDGIGQAGVGGGRGQDGSRRGELGQGLIGGGVDDLNPGDFRRGRRVQHGPQSSRLAQGGVHVAGHLGRGDDEVDVVRIIAVAHQALVARVADEGLVGPRRRHVQPHGVGVAPAPHIDVAGHVDQVAGAGGARRGQAVGGGLGPLGIGGLQKVDVEMGRLHMGRVAGEDGLDQTHGLAAAADGGAFVGFPVVPRRGVHRRLGGQDGDVVVLGKAPGDRQHGVGVGGVQRGAVGGGVARIAQGQGLDQGLLARADLLAQGHGPIAGVQRGGPVAVVHRGVDVGAQGHGLTPPAGGAVGIQALRFAEGAHGPGVVEAVGEHQPLAEIGLGAGIVGRRLERRGRQVGIEGYGLGLTGRCGDGGGDQQLAQQGAARLSGAADRIERAGRRGGQGRQGARARQDQTGAAHGQGFPQQSHAPSPSRV